MDSKTPAKLAKETPPPYTLTVKHAFADYQIGEQITKPEEVAAVLAGECACNVLKVFKIVDATA